jgi:multidrug resistance protein MdtO
MPEKIANYARGDESRGVSFSKMFWDGLKPFPGRGLITLRLAVACTLIELVADTFRMPLQDLLPFFVLFVTKEEKVTTALSALLVLFAVTLAIVAAILIYKATGDRAEFRIPGIALEIFIGMYLFRVLSIPAVGWILGFVVAAAQSLVYLFPNAEETVHQFLWLWVAVAFSTVVAWLANLLLFPVSATRLLQREFVARCDAVSAAAEQLTTNQPSASALLLRPLVKGGPIRFLKLLKLSLIGSPDLRGKQVQLRRMILSLDKITRLIFSYAKAHLKSSASVAIASGEAAVLGGLKKEAKSFQQEFEAGFVPSPTATRPATETAGIIASRLREAENTLQDLAGGDAESENHPQKAARRKPSLFVADAFSNPRHVQFALKVTLAGMIGYLFYTASDYYGIHTVFYTPLIIALASTGATVHKGFLRIVGCSIGGALGLICSIWVIPRFETLGTFLFIVFCVHGLAAWIAVGDDRISYIGLQIALAFDLGFLQGYGPPDSIDPIRDRFIGIVLGICIVTTVFAVIWPESADLSARERLAAGLRTIAQLLRVGRTHDGSQNSNSQREQLELEIASRLSEANSYEEQAAFEELIHGSIATERPKLENAIAATEEIYVCSLPWVREQRSGQTIQEDGQSKSTPEFAERLPNAVETCADRIDQRQRQIADQDQTPIDYLIEKTDSDAGKKAGSLEELLSAVVELQVLVSARER